MEDCNKMDYFSTKNRWSPVLNKESTFLLARTMLYLYNLFTFCEVINKIPSLNECKLTVQLLDEMIDNGFPLTTEPNILREMIAPPNIVSKVLSVVTGNTSNMSNTLPGATSSCVPWRKTDLKHSSNEVYVDLVEEMDATINRCNRNFKNSSYISLSFR